MWRRKSLIQIALVAATLGRSVTDAFVVVLRPAAGVSLTTSHVPTRSVHAATRRMAAADANQEEGSEAEEKETSQARKPRRRKRKVLVSEEVEAVAEASVELKPRRSEAPVAFSVTDVRTLVGGSTTSNAATLSETSSPSAKVATATTMETPSPVSTGGATTSSDSLEQLLQDAKEMQALENTKEDQGDSAQSSIVATIRNVISTIVTVDFFVVCTFLVWFLAGVFSSYVLKNDAVQIAFNSNFQMLVQPALGVLMIGSLAGAVFEEKDDNDGGSD